LEETSTCIVSVREPRSLSGEIVSQHIDINAAAFTLAQASQ
jgi:hypothetical protein